MTCFLPVAKEMEEQTESVGVLC